MKTQIQLYSDIKRIVSFFSKQLKFDKFKNKLGRKLALSLEEIISIALFKQKNGIPTKKAVYEMLKLKCSYKTAVVNFLELRNADSPSFFKGGLGWIFKEKISIGPPLPKGEA